MEKLAINLINLRKPIDLFFINTSDKHWHLQNFLHVSNSLQSRLQNV